MNVLINAQVPAGGRWGGVEQFLRGLVYALGRLTDGDERYTLITDPQHPDWLKPQLGPNQRIVAAPRRKVTRVERGKQLLGPLRAPAGKLWRAIGIRPPASHDTAPQDPTLPQSNGFLESLGGDVIHFPYQDFISCRLPAIFNPHDLQHVHSPQFFSAGEIKRRETLYRAACEHAQAVATDCLTVKHDLVKQYGLAPEKIFAVMWGSPTVFYEEAREGDLSKIRSKFGLPERFAFYPAQTWPHKNHLRLLEAIGLLRDCSGISLNLVCTGAKSDYWPAIKRRVSELKLGRQVSFLGYISSAELRALYHLAHFLVFPSLFEGGGLPVLEGMHEGLPVICSDLPPLREYGGDAVLTFDPHCTESIAAALQRISSDEGLREQLRARGKERARLFTWERAGKIYRAIYRRLAGVALSEEDLFLLDCAGGR